LTNGTKKETKDVLEMLGEFFREAAVLVLIFLPLEISRNEAISVPMAFLIGFECIAFLLMGISLEKWRGE
jgi:hypothetical protein